MKPIEFRTQLIDIYLDYLGNEITHPEWEEKSFQLIAEFQNPGTTWCCEVCQDTKTRTNMYHCNKCLDRTPHKLIA